MRRIRISGFVRLRFIFFAIALMTCAFTVYQLFSETYSMSVYFMTEHQSVPKQCTNNKSKSEKKIEFDTFDIFRDVVAGARQIPHEPNPRSGPKTGPLNVFVVPMSHVDPGWLKTFIEYSVDTNKILNNMVEFLGSHPDMRFLWCEISFFEHWWSAQDESAKISVRKFVSNGQLEFASGSWVMTDEATPYFPATVDNIVEGQQFLYNELGVQPKVIWSNDPFGYGPSVPYLFTKTGINRAVINRIHHQIKQHLQANRAVPFQWYQNFDIDDERSAVHTHVLPYSHYDILNSCGPNQDICCSFDFKRLTHFFCAGESVQAINEGNVENRAKQLENQLMQMSELYQTNDLLVMWGDDFRYDMIEEWHQQYDNLSPLFNQINAEQNTKIRFGSISDYFDALDKREKQAQYTPANLTGDFFPYQCALGDYWTGYYTTRPFFKKQERELHALLRAADLLTASAFLKLSGSDRQKIDRDLTVARRNLALFQHHDAITGTSRKHVMDDYSQRLFTSMHMVAEILKRSTNAILNSTFAHFDNIPMAYNEGSKHQLIRISQPKSIVVYNSLPHRRIELITLRVSGAAVSVTVGGKVVRSQVEPYIDPVSGTITDHYKLIFYAILRPLALAVYTVQEPYRNRGAAAIASIKYVAEDDSEGIVKIQNFAKDFDVQKIKPDGIILETARETVKFGVENGLLESYRFNDQEITLKQTFNQYNSLGSGAYVMRVHQNSEKFKFVGLSRFIVDGPMRSTAFTFAAHLQQQVSISKIDDSSCCALDLNLRVDIRDLVTQLVTRLETNLNQSSLQFYTDSIGLQLMERQHYESVSISANYYPMPTALILQDDELRLSVLSDIGHGAGMFNDGGFEIMIDRLTTIDDGKGLGSSKDGIPDDMLPVNIAFRIVLERAMQTGNTNEHHAFHTIRAHETLQSLIYRPIILFADVEINMFGEYLNLQSFPCDIQLLSNRALPKSKSDDVRLLIAHRTGLACTANQHCFGVKFQQSLKLYLHSLGVRRVQQTQLSGIQTTGDLVDVDSATFELDRMDFMTYLLHF